MFKALVAATLTCSVASIASAAISVANTPVYSSNQYSQDYTVDAIDELFDDTEVVEPVAASLILMSLADRRAQACDIALTHLMDAVAKRDLSPRESSEYAIAEDQASHLQNGMNLFCKDWNR